MGTESARKPYSKPFFSGVQVDVEITIAFDQEMYDKIKIKL